VVGLGQVQHVVDHLRHPLQFFQVAVQRFAVFLEAARAGEGDLGVGQQVGQRRAQFVGDVGRERRQALEGVVQALQHGVDRGASSASSSGMRQRQAWSVSGLDAGGHLAHLPQRRSPLRAAQAPSSAVASADRPTVSQIRLHALQEVLVMGDVEQQGQLRRSAVSASAVLRLR
jgi:hypothetical protein